MKPVVTLLVVALGATGIASAIALRQDVSVTISGRNSDESRHGGPDSARVDLYFTALRNTDPMLCEMMADQLGNFWTSYGEFGVGLLADASRSWEKARDSLYSTATDPAALRRMTRGLDDQNACVRRAAAKLLGRSRERGLPAIRESLRSPSARVREAAALAAGHAELEQLEEDITRATRDQNAAVVAMAAWALGELEHPQAIGRLSELTRSADVRVRRAATHGLGQIEDARSVGAIVPLLRDSDEGVRVLAASALGDIESASAVDPLIDALKDPSAAVRRAAASALGAIENVRAAPARGRAGRMTR
jgi:HEAT repeat protein